MTGILCVSRLFYPMRCATESWGCVMSSSLAAQVAEHQARSHAPATAEQMAELIGQIQHLIELEEALIGRNPYTPLVVDLSKGTSQTVNLPAEGHQIETLQVSGDTGVTVKIFLQHQGVLSSGGQLIGQVYMPANSVAPPLVLNCAVPPTGATLLITTSGAVVNGSCVVTLARTRPGGYPYAG